MQGVVDLVGKLDEAGFQYQARNRSKIGKLDTPHRSATSETEVEVMAEEHRSTS
jgi:hypothetical protein